MTTNLLTALASLVGPLPTTPTRTPTDAELAADDYWAGVGESRREESLLPMSRGDEDHRQRGYDAWLERDAS